VNYEFGHINAGILICNKCDRVWHVSDYGFDCPACEEPTWMSAKSADTTRELCMPLRKMENIFTFVKNAINGQTGMKI
jgi:hypothetical protein